MQRTARRRLAVHVAAGLIVVAGIGCGPRPDAAEEPAVDSTNSALPEARLCGDKVVTDSAVGELRIGATVADVRARCTIARDTTAPRAEGQEARVISVVFGSDTVDAEVVADRVWRIEVTDPAFTTADSLRVGTGVGALLDLPGLRPLSGEGNVFVMTTAHCGLSFQLSVPDTGASAGRWRADDLRRLPAGTEVTRVLVIGCGR
jgi:hypothetical protein